MTWHLKPELRDPIVFIGLSGWSDAAHAASGAIDYLVEQAVEVTRLASTTAEEFYDFSQTRPEIEIIGGLNHDLTWPTVQLAQVRLPDWEGDIVVVEGPEPELRWPTLIDGLVDAFHAIGAANIVLLGSFIANIAHTAPISIMAVASDPHLTTERNLQEADYQGPTGLVGALNAACSRAGFRTVGLWAAIPHYLAANPNPRAMLALLETARTLTGAELNLDALEAEALSFHRSIEAAVAASTELADYVAELEEGQERHDLEPEAGERLVGEIERFLRDSD